MEQLERKDMQGFVVTSYSHLSCAAYVMLRIVDPAAARAWLGTLADEVVPAERERRAETRVVNVALTYRGLASLGLDDDSRATFPVAFKEGIASKRRARILGDSGQDAPELWDWGGPSPPELEREIDLVQLIFAPDEASLEAQVEQREAQRTGVGGTREIVRLTAGRQEDTREHFGFADGVAQPDFEEDRRAARAERRRAASGMAQNPTFLNPGEVVLGYKDSYDKFPPTPTVARERDPGGLLRDAPASGPSAGRRDLGRNGTYVVFRQLAQHPAEFWQFLDGATRRPDGSSDVEAQLRLAAKMVGRWPSGAPLGKHSDRDPHLGSPTLSKDDAFRYAEDGDADGFGCPIGAHIRRANPRDSLPPDPKTALASADRHRLVRRGRLYGTRLDPPWVDLYNMRQPNPPPADDERGLFFICLNTDLERQFEFVQQTWVNNAVFAGLYDERDPLIGSRDDDAERMTIQAEPLRRRVAGLGRFVTVRGGAYFFLPGVSTLRYFASLKD